MLTLDHFHGTNAPQPQGLTPSEMYAHQGNICTADDDDATAAAFASPEFSGFDVAAVGLGFHHFDDPALAARKLAARLKVGGVLVIIDFLPHGKPDVSGRARFPFLYCTCIHGSIPESVCPSAQSINHAQTGKTREE